MLHELCEHQFARIHDEKLWEKIPVSQNIQVQVRDTHKCSFYHFRSTCYLTV